MIKIEAVWLPAPGGRERRYEVAFIGEAVEFVERLDVRVCRWSGLPKLQRVDVTRRWAEPAMREKALNTPVVSKVIALARQQRAARHEVGSEVLT